MDSDIVAVKVNKFGDTIVEAPSSGAVESFLSQYDSSKVTILKIRSKNLTNSTRDPLKDFTFVHSAKGIDIYANKLAKEKCPPIIDGRLCGVVAAVIVNVDSEQFAVLVKDRTKASLTNPAGFVAESSEAPVETAKREVFEETGLVVEKLVPCGRSSRKYLAYDNEFSNETDIFYAQVTITQDEMEKATKHNDHEIEKVYFLPIDRVSLDKVATGLEYPIMEHHVTILRFVISGIQGQEIDWKALVPSYMTSMELRW